MLTFTHDPFNGAPEGTERTPARSWRTRGCRRSSSRRLQGPLGLVVSLESLRAPRSARHGHGGVLAPSALGCASSPRSSAGTSSHSARTPSRRSTPALSMTQNWAFLAVLASPRPPRTAIVSPSSGSWGDHQRAFYISAYQGVLTSTAVSLFCRRAPRLPTARGTASVRWRSLPSFTSCDPSRCSPIAYLYSPREVHCEGRGALTTPRSLPLPARVPGVSPSFAAKSAGPLRPRLHPGYLNEEALFFGYSTMGLAITVGILLFRPINGSIESPTVGGRRSPWQFSLPLLSAVAPADLPRRGRSRIPMPSISLPE